MQRLNTSLMKCLLGLIEQITESIDVTSCHTWLAWRCQGQRLVGEDKYKQIIDLFL